MHDREQTPAALWSSLLLGAAALAWAGLARSGSVPRSAGLVAAMLALMAADEWWELHEDLGGAFYTGTGLTLIIPVFNTPIFADSFGVLRKGHGFVGMASIKLGGTKIAGGAGISQLALTKYDEQQQPFAQLVPPKRQLGISAGLYQSIFDQLTWALEYFRGQYTWYDYRDSAGNVAQPKQAVNFVNTGLTLVF